MRAAFVALLAGLTLTACAAPKRFYVVQQDEMLGWTRSAVAEALTFSAPDPEAELATARGNFTTRGWLEFRHALDQQQVLATARRHDLQVTGQVGEPVILASEGARGDGLYAWQVRVPVQLALRAPDSVAGGQSQLTLRVVQGPEKLAIDGWQAN